MEEKTHLIRLHVPAWVKNILVIGAKKRGMKLADWLIPIAVKEAEKELGVTVEEFRERGKNDVHKS